MGQSFTCLHYHLIFSTKSREPLIVPQMRQRLYDYIGGIIEGENGRLLAAGGTYDHVHLLAFLHQRFSVADVLRDIKANSSKWIHQTFDGGWSRSGFVKAFNKLRQRAGFHFFPIDVGEDEADRTKRKKLVAPKGLPSLEFNQIRDGAYTAAIEGGAEPMHAQILAGHRTGIKDSYVKRNPKMVADACASIEKHYFPDKK